MIEIFNHDRLKGKKFVDCGTNEEFICIGFGQSPETGVMYLIGTAYDATEDTTSIKTVLFKNCRIQGDIHLGV